jgi:hypothetical protein
MNKKYIMRLTAKERRELREVVKPKGSASDDAAENRYGSN